MRELVAFDSLLSDQVGQSSRAARAGVKLVRLFTALSALKPLLVLIVTVAISLVGLVEPGFAQSVLNGDASRPVRAVQSLIQVAMWGTLAVGIGGLCWAGWNKTAGKPWGGQLVGGFVCLGISGVIAFVNQIANGDAPDLGDF
jgi:hypothetical protein